MEPPGTPWKNNLEPPEKPLKKTAMARSFNDEITYTCCFLAQALECVRQQTHNPLRKMSDALRDAWLNGRADRLGAKGEALAWALRKAWYAQGMG